MHRRTPLLLATLALALTASAPRSAPAAGTPLTVSLSCHIDSQTCQATASGGSGEGYSFEWSWPFAEQYDADGTSYGDINCVPYYGVRTISVTVTDSWNGYAYDSTSFYCPA